MLNMAPHVSHNSSYHTAIQPHLQVEGGFDLKQGNVRLYQNWVTQKSCSESPYIGYDIVACKY